MTDCQMSGYAKLLQHCAPELAEALEEVLNVLVGCVKPAGGCDDANYIANAIDRGEAALAAAGRMLVREVPHG